MRYKYSTNGSQIVVVDTKADYEEYEISVTEAEEMALYIRSMERNIELLKEFISETKNRYGVTTEVFGSSYSVYPSKDVDLSELIFTGFFDGITYLRTNMIQKTVHVMDAGIPCKVELVDEFTIFDFTKVEGTWEGCDLFISSAREVIFPNDKNKLRVSYMYFDNPTKIRGYIGTDSLNISCLTLRCSEFNKLMEHFSYIDNFRVCQLIAFRKDNLVKVPKIENAFCPFTLDVSETEEVVLDMNDVKGKVEITVDSINLNANEVHLEFKNVNGNLADIVEIRAGLIEGRRQIDTEIVGTTIKVFFR